MTKGKSTDGALDSVGSCQPLLLAPFPYELLTTLTGPFIIYYFSHPRSLTRVLTFTSFVDTGYRRVWHHYRYVLYQNRLLNACWTPPPYDQSAGSVYAAANRALNSPNLKITLIEYNRSQYQSI